MDQSYVNQKYSLSEIKHHYGENVHILSNPMAQSFLTKLSSPNAVQPILNSYIEYLYSTLLEAVVGHSFPRVKVQTDTRMKEFSEKGTLEIDVIDPNTHIVSVDLARAGIYPSHLCYHHLNFILDPKNLRQDHFYAQRKVNEKNEVVGVDVTGSKIGGPVDDAIILLPDPMGATGGSLSYAISHYKNEVKGKAKKFICMNLIVTPEYIKRMTTDHPDVEIFALRVDRGLSPKDVLLKEPGQEWDREVGLNEHQYIVPGAGGVGEVLNNAFI
ncbi:uracil phosphoribosyltransferase [Halobacteriovorax sp. GB3]|uniref:uracil phosphoribosyltransferase n=1 Tax=Halobacteriovorax sp. GB3 TaxID=2719615 RepID=UPI00236303AC|nr:uracil phosphoribosyltransferase [Halobacteriovorax sp. GB3]MDD0851572.1 uracil phosphoribosyltransferase [Halobacteriovorax sp. GB3]